jgi:hypothetical protein
MGCTYQRSERWCMTCGGRRLARKRDREACVAAGHVIEERKSPVYWVKYSRGARHTSNLRAARGRRTRSTC